MNKHRLRSHLAIALLSAASSATPAFATGDFWTRKPTSASIAPCTGTLVEQVEEGGSVMSSRATLSLACMTSSPQADWVLISSEFCGAGSKSGGTCEGKAAAPTIDRIRTIANYAESSSSSIRLGQAELGRLCLHVPSRSGSRWECNTVEHLDGTTVNVVAGKFSPTDPEVGVSVFGRTQRIPLSVAVAEPVKPPSSLVWRSPDPRHAYYSQPETDSLASLHCTGPGTVELTVGDPYEKSRGSKDRVGKVFAGANVEQAPFRVVDGDGDHLTFTLRAEGPALSTLAEGGDIRIQIPSGVAVRVTGRTGGKVIGRLQAACGGASPTVRPATQARPAPANATNDRYDGWWVVLATGSDAPDRQSNGGLVVDRIAARCGIRTFNDFSAKFVGFKPGYNAFVLLGSPYGSRDMAERNRRVVENCFPQAYVKKARYLGE